MEVLVILLNNRSNVDQQLNRIRQNVDQQLNRIRQNVALNIFLILTAISPIFF